MNYFSNQISSHCLGTGGWIALSTHPGGRTTMWLKITQGTRRASLSLHSCDLFPNSILPILNSSWPTHDNLLSSWTKFFVFYWSRIYTFPIHSNSLSPQILDHCVSLSCACLTPHRPFCPCSALSLSTTQPIQIYMWGMIYKEEYLI